MRYSMKRTLLLIYILILCVPVLVFSQMPTGKPITFKARNKSLEYVLREMSLQSGIPISYSNTQLPLEKKISVNLKKEPLNSALDIVLSPLKLQYVYVENQVVIKPRPPQKDEPLTSAKPVEYTIKGYIKDGKNGEAIPGATVYTDDIKYGTTSNNYGFFSITLPENNYRLIISFMGYKTQQYDIKLTAHSNLNVKLQEEELMLEPVVINDAIDSNRFVQINRTGYTEMPAARTARMPVFIAEPDVIKAMQYLPGIKNTIDGSGNYYVRGGERDQNLILLDDAPVYNPSHLFGFFTCINPEALTDIKLYKSDFPAHVGGKLSSVLDLKTKEGNNNKFSMSGEMGPVTARISAESPLFKKKASFYTSFRTSHIQGLANRASPNITDFRFNDLNAKFNVPINDKNRLLFSFYSGNDFFYVRKWNSDKQGINWGNRTGSLRWNKIFGTKLFSNTTAYFSRYDYNFFTSISDNTRWNSSIGTLGIKDDFIYFKKPEVTHYFGVSFIAGAISPGVVLSDAKLNAAYIPNIQEHKTGETNLYFSSNRELNKKLTLRYGLRATLFANKGSISRYTLSDSYHIVDTITETGKGAYNRYLRAEPSVTLTWLLDNRNSLKFNYFRAHQYMQLLSNSISPFTTIEVWHPSTPNVKPQSSDQISAGYYRNFSESPYMLVVEGFFKHMRNQFDYNNQSNLLLNPYIESELRFGTTNAWGGEITLRREYGSVQGWLGYAYTRAVRQTKDINFNNPYPAYSDRPYDVSLYIQYTPVPKFLFTTGLIYAAGMPFTVPTGYFDYMGSKIPLYTLKNNARMPDYFRLDVSAQIMLNKPGNKWEHFITLSVFNLTNHKNPVFINFNKIVDTNGNFIIPSNYAANNTLEASQIVLLGITPGIKYNFRF